MGCALSCLVPETDRQTAIRNRRIKALLMSVLVHMEFILYGSSSGMKQLVLQQVTAVPQRAHIPKRKAGQPNSQTPL
ncbi:hypothetical protein BLNAU_4977 [Blattamonas nauphoetae]|uniref:Uncharacterized protein n=1 Tax=Blattamonas nauphoetae TaxID=2049346 RepID=A0ABQ9Y8V2_9EUKA|nr:hypothetical protein BLNAU_4977 [Blattamonas nauphoetae]